MQTRTTAYPSKFILKSIEATKELEKIPGFLEAFEKAKICTSPGRNWRTVFKEIKS